jgi:hypothetical protein
VTSTPCTATRNQRPADLLTDDRGAVMVIGVFMAMLVTGFLYYIIGIGNTIIYRERMQDAADVVAFGAAVTYAKGMNLVALINQIMALLVAIYPIKAWRDAPFFPTPRGALEGLGRLARLRTDARVLEAGCGLGDGLRELHAEFPQARIDGIEWSWPLRLACQWRCGFARVRRGDIWQADWSPFQMVYVFQRPESMPRAVDKAARELAHGSWLASLEFEALRLEPDAVHRCRDGRCVWLYQQPFKPRTQPPPAHG